METAKIHNDGILQTIEVPSNFRFPGERVFVKRIGNSLVILPEAGAWEPLLASLGEFTEDFMSERAQPSAQIREDWSE